MIPSPLQRDRPVTPNTPQDSQTLTAEQTITLLNQVLDETAKELGCENDNEAILQAIHDLKQRASLPSPPVSGETVALYQLELENGEIEHLSGCFAGVSEIDGVRVVKSTPLYTSPLTNEPVWVMVNRDDLERVLRKIELIRENPCNTIGHRIIFSVREAAARLSAAIGERG